MRRLRQENSLNPAYEICSELLISRIYKQLKQTYKKKKQPHQKWARDMNRHFTKEDIYEANNHMKNSSSSLVIKEMQIKTTLRYYQMPVRMAFFLRLLNDFPPSLFVDSLRVFLS